MPRGSLIEFLAVRLLLDRRALAFTAREAMGYDGPLSKLRDWARAGSAAARPHSVEQRAFVVFQLDQVAGLSADQLFHWLGPARVGGDHAEIETFSDAERRRIFHLAYERRFYTQALDAIALHAKGPAPTPERPRFQAVFCLDEREESFRRHLEELAPDVETFGVAGFFAVAMYYRGAADAHFTPLCPVVVRPQQWVTEVVEDLVEGENRRRARTRRLLGAASLRFHIGSRSLRRRGVAHAVRWGSGLVPLVARILFPAAATTATDPRRMVGRIVQTPPFTRLQMERADAGPGPGR